MRTVWTVERGSYSDYHVVGIYETKAQAETVVAKMNTDDYDVPFINEWPLNLDIKEIEAGLDSFSVRFKVDASGYEVEKDSFYRPCEEFHWDSGHFYRVMADAPEAAVKIASEKLGQYLAEKHL